MRIPDNARCCIGVVVFHEVTVGNSMGRRNTVFDAKSEHPLLKESGRLREYDQVYAKQSPFRTFDSLEYFRKICQRKRREKNMTKNKISY